MSELSTVSDPSYNGVVSLLFSTTKLGPEVVCLILMTRSIISKQLKEPFAFHDLTRSEQVMVQIALIELLSVVLFLKLVKTGN